MHCHLPYPQEVFPVYQGNRNLGNLEDVSPESAPNSVPVQQHYTSLALSASAKCKHGQVRKKLSCILSVLISYALLKPLIIDI